MKPRIQFIIAASGLTIASILGWAFRCRHRRTTFPQTVRDRNGNRGGTFVSCLECSKTLPYDWASMKVIEGLQAELKKLKEDIYAGLGNSPHSLGDRRCASASAVTPSEAGSAAPAR